jgi:hypothetical protein
MNPGLFHAVDPRVMTGYAVLVAALFMIYRRAHTPPARLAVYALAVAAVLLYLLFFAPR